MKPGTPRIRCLAIALLCAMPIGPALAEGRAEHMDLEELRALVIEQQRSIEELTRAVRDLSAQESRPRAAAGPDEAMGEQLYELRERTSRLEWLVGDTELGGWLDFVFRDSSRDGQSPVFDPQHLYLYFDTRVHERWQAFAEVEFEHLPGFDSSESSGEIKIERLYIQHGRSDLLNARLGKFNTPFGYWTPIHWAILVDSIQKPIHEDNEYVPRKQVGVELFGSAYDGLLSETPLRLEYAGYVSNGSEIVGTEEAEDSDPGYGFDLRATVAESVLFGFSSHFQRNPDALGRSERSFMVYANLELPPVVTLRGEYFHQSRSAGSPNRRAGYAKIRLDFAEKAYLNYRFGIGDDDKRGAGARHIENVVTLGYRIVPNLRVKAEWAYNTFRDSSIEDYHFWGLHAGFFF